MNAAFPLLLACFLVVADDKRAAPPAPKLPLGKDTTYVNGPFDKEGYIDYEAAINAEMSRDISREKNANVLIISALGPAPEGGNAMPAAYFRWLDIPIPPKEGAYYLSLGKLVREHLALTNAQLEEVFEQQSRAGQRPWVAKDYPVIADWLRLNEKPLALALEGVKRPEYFNPIVTNRKEGEASNLIGGLLPSVQKCRELSSAFTALAMLRLGEGKPDDAWQYILACHRLGRLVSRGATLIEGLVGVAICTIANNTTLAYLDNAKLTSKQAAERLKDLRNLPQMASCADKIDFMERFSGLDALQALRRGQDSSGYLFAEVFGENNPLTEEDLKTLRSLDWTPAMRSMNKWYDRMAAAMRLKDRAAREKEFDKMDAELVEFKKVTFESGTLGKLLLGKDAAKTAGKTIGDSLLALLTPAVRKVQNAHDRAAQVEQNLHLAFAMAAYHADHDSYPKKLEELAPKYLAVVPGDLFSGKALIYKPTENGYLFYSVGVNGKDDGGRYYDDDPPGDDLAVRMPLPPLKKK